MDNQAGFHPELNYIENVVSHVYYFAMCECVEDCPGTRCAGPRYRLIPRKRKAEMLTDKPETYILVNEMEKKNVEEKRRKEVEEKNPRDERRSKRKKKKSRVIY